MVGTRTRETLRKRVAIFCVRTSDTLLQFIPLPPAKSDTELNHRSLERCATIS